MSANVTFRTYILPSNQKPCYNHAKKCLKTRKSRHSPVDITRLRHSAYYYPSKINPPLNPVNHKRLRTKCTEKKLSHHHRESIIQCGTIARCPARDVFVSIAACLRYSRLVCIRRYTDMYRGAAVQRQKRVTAMGEYCRYAFFPLDGRGRGAAPIQN